jgi:membrane protease YdiL (CAAX protease family)
MLSPETREEALRRIALKISVLKIKEHFWIYGIVLSILHSCLEEFYWRFFMLGAWKKQAPLVKAHIIAGLAFTLHHFTVTVHYFDFSLGMILGLGVWAAGLIWSYLYELEDSLLATWISHIIADMALIFIGFYALSSIH